MCAEGGGEAHAGEVYYVGIIDVLQEYNARKWAETKMLQLLCCRKTEEVSCVPPKLYARRFREFIIRLIA